MIRRIDDDRKVAKLYIIDYSVRKCYNRKQRCRNTVVVYKCKYVEKSEDNFGRISRDFSESSCRLLM